ncbi:MAG: hypothetical protein GXO90_00100, partial [FCB group bacterium]|nr:hypothetical protein [FCB group bacterium]
MTAVDPSPSVETLLAEAHTSEPALAAFLKTLISKAAEKSVTAPGAHPLITVNALKNLLSDRRTEPPPSILKWIFHWVTAFPDAADTEMIPDRKRRKEMPGTLFISDLEEAIEAGDQAAMITSSSSGYWFLASASPESLLNVFLQHLCSAGPGWPELLYAAHRSAAFCQSGETLWKIMVALIRMIPEGGIPLRDIVSPSTSPEAMTEKILQTGNPEFIVRFSASLRLWELDNPRQVLIRKALGVAMQTLEKDVSSREIISVSPEEAAGEKNYLSLLQGMIEEPVTDQRIELSIRTLDALRFLIPRINQNKLP